MEDNLSLEEHRTEQTDNATQENLTIIQIQSPKNEKASLDSDIKNADKNDFIKTLYDPLDFQFLDKTEIVLKPAYEKRSTCYINQQTNNRFMRFVEAEKPVKIRISSVIKERFILKSILGVGGMGKVYKALDIRKQEAHDKNPYVAIKVLNDEFRNHPESLIALQREARKSQQLSHPNIVNVFDFDRDNDVVFMTMELLQGKSLDTIIADDFPHGMPIDQALGIINSVSNALFYAHQYGIVHSDLKPSNIFITSDKVAKVFDFGIARACKLTHKQNDSDRTLFDPTKLGALTPTYASLQMLQGQAPEPIDDLYSIACVFYELLTGNHPYNRLPADEAKKLNLKPKKIATISYAKANVINKALNFDSNERFDNLELFIKAFNQKKTFKIPILAFIAVTAISNVVFFSPILLKHYNNYQQKVFITTLYDSERINRDNLFGFIHNHIRSLDHTTKHHVLERIKEKYINLVQQRVNYLVDDDHKRYCYEQATKLLTTSQQYYPDSAQIERLFALVENKKFKQLHLFNNRFNELLEVSQLSFFAEPGIQKEIKLLVKNIKNIEPDHAMLKDERLLFIFLESIQYHIHKKNYLQAQQLLQTSQEIYFKNNELKNLEENFKSIKKESSVSISNDNKNRSTLSLTELKQQLLNLLQQNEIDTHWEDKIRELYSLLNINLGKKSKWLHEKKQILAEIYLQQSIKMRNQHRLTEARRNLDEAKKYNNVLYGISDEEAILDAMINIDRIKLQAKKHQATIKGLKITLNTQVKALKVDAATRTYKQLKRLLGRNDKFVIGEARQAITQAYYKQAKQLLADKKYTLSLASIKKGLSFHRYHNGLRKLQKIARKESNLINESQLVTQKMLKNSTP